MWKALFRIIILLLILYISRPLWEKYTEPYIDLGFLEPVDQQVHQLKESEWGKWLQQTGTSIKKNARDVWDNFRVKKVNPVEEGVGQQTDASPSTPSTPLTLGLGMSKDVLEKQVGAPKRSLLNDYGTNWFVYHQNYASFLLVAYDGNQKIEALYTNSPQYLAELTQQAMQKNDVRQRFGTPIEAIRKGRTDYLIQSSEGLDVFSSDQQYIYAFYDEHENLRLNSLLLVSHTLEQRKKSMYASRSTNLQNSYEQLMFELINSTRQHYQLGHLTFNSHLASTARKHSLDMATHHFFDHTNLKGQSPFDRMKADRISYTRAGENLAYGQFSPIFAHEGLMNSYDHRLNTLTSAYKVAGIGVAFDEENVPYFTNLFLQ